MRSARRSLVPWTSLALVLALGAPRAAAQSEVVFDFSPFTPDSVGGEMIVLGTQPLNIVHARVDATFVSNDPGPWSIWVNFGFPTGLVGVDSQMEGWAGAGTFSKSFTSDELNGYVAPAPGQSSYLWFVEWAGGHPITLPGGGIGLAPVDGVFTQLVLTLTVVEAPPAAWLDLGHALAGTLGEPLLTGNGNLCRSAPGSLVLSNARPGGSTFLVVGLASVWAPFKGGLLLPSPDLVLALPIDAAGTSALPFTFPIGMPMGLQFWVQHWIPDPAGVAGFAASNALLATVPSDC
jgi:hypothetical protein